MYVHRHGAPWHTRDQCVRTSWVLRRARGGCGCCGFRNFIHALIIYLLLLRSNSYRIMAYVLKWIRKPPEPVPWWQRITKSLLRDSVSSQSVSRMYTTHYKFIGHLLLAPSRTCCETALMGHSLTAINHFGWRLDWITEFIIGFCLVCTHVYRDIAFLQVMQHGVLTDSCSISRIQIFIGCWVRIISLWLRETYDHHPSGTEVRSISIDGLPSSSQLYSTHLVANVTMSSRLLIRLEYLRSKTESTKSLNYQLDPSPPPLPSSLWDIMTGANLRLDKAYLTAIWLETFFYGKSHILDPTPE